MNNNFDPIANGATAFDPIKEGATPVTSQPADRGLIGGASDLLRSLGLGALPDIAGEATAIPSELGTDFGAFTGKLTPQQAADQMRQNLNNNQFLKAGTGDRDIPQNMTDPNQMKAAIKNNVSDMQSTPLEDAAGIGSWIMPGTDLLQGSKLAGLATMLGKGALRGEMYATSQGQPTNVGDVAGGALLEPLATIIGGLRSGKLTEAGVNNAYNKVHAASAGNTTTSADLLKQVEEYFAEPQNEFKSPQLKSEVMRAIQSKTPAPITAEEAATQAPTVLQTAPDFEGTTNAYGGPFTKGPNGEFVNPAGTKVNDAQIGQANTPQGATAIDGVGGVSKTGANMSQQEVPLNSRQIHLLRQEMGNAINWSKKSGSPRPVGEQANQIAYGILSDAMHKLAPGTEPLDTLYSLYQKGLFSKIGVPKLGSVKYPSSIKGVPAPFISALAAIIGDKTLKKFTGLGL